MQRRVVITGMGAITPIGLTVEDFWASLLEGKSGAAPITRFDPEHFKTKFACELKQFDAQDYLDRNEVRKNDPFVQYGLIVAGQAIANAGLDLDKTDRYRTGVIWGSGNGGIHTFEEQVSEFATGTGVPRFNPFFIPKILVNMASGMISIKFGLKGINYTTVSACATGTSAIMDAFNYIRWGQADIMLAGGSEAPITKASIGGFNALKALSTRNEEAQTASRPFDVTRDGFVMGEGGGALVLEELEHARARGAHIIAEVVGCAQTSDAYHMTAVHPEGEGAKRGMQLALQDAGLKASDVDYLNAHATSTPLGDIGELKAIQSVFSGNEKLNVSATKSMTGHLLGAAGAIEAITCIQAIRHGAVPPTANTSQPDDEIPAGLDLTLGKSVQKPVKVAMSNTFGFGGHNAIALFKAFEN
ncbi:beta-ketoacyl-ACP synthase II [Roseivirga sp. BDSF3-8]|uniref:beta-ketoacyl-ACP synthase II n=1 Tax=Roseivirga sp. BDSF3-8 TaxID=3241598 RepID=UPI0035324D9E